MSKNKPSKSLLNETQIRKFMKLAQLEPLTPSFVKGLTSERRETRPPGGAAGATHGRSDKPIPGTDLMAEEEDTDELEGDIEHDLGDDSLEGDEEAIDDEEEIATEEPAMAAGDRTIRIDDFLAALERALEEASGEEVEVDATAMEDEEVVDDAAADLDADDDMDMGLDDEDELMEGTKEGDELNDDEDDGARGEKKGDKAYINETSDELVERITKRVAARILKTALKK